LDKSGDKLGIAIKKVEPYAKMNLAELFSATSEKGYEK